MRRALRSEPVGTAVAMLATFALLAPLAHVARQSDSFIVLGVVLCMTTTRNTLRRGVRARADLLRHTALVPVLIAAVAMVGTLVARQRLAADTLFVAAAFAALWTRRFSPAVSTTVRIVQLPLVALLVAPVPAADRGLHGLPWMLVAAVVATACSTLAPLFAGVPRREERRPVAAEARTEPAGVEVGPGVEVGHDGPEPAGTRLTSAGTRAPRPEGRRRIPATTRLALQTAIGLSGAFAVGQGLFPTHWTWTVVSAFTVGAGARSRGDVIVKGAERLAGALLGTAGATALVAAFGGDRVGSVVAILVLLSIGTVLRPRTYAAWAFSVTASLALLYGLFGEPTTSLLGERLEEVAIGAGIAVAAAVVCLPIRTEAVTRRTLADTLSLLDQLLARASSGEGPAPEPLHAALEAGVARLREVSRPLQIANRLGLPAGRGLSVVELAHRHVHAASPLLAAAADGSADRAALGAHRRRVNALRRQLRQPLASIAAASDTAEDPAEE